MNRKHIGMIINIISENLIIITVFGNFTIDKSKLDCININIYDLVEFEIKNKSDEYNVFGLADIIKIRQYRINEYFEKVINNYRCFSESKYDKYLGRTFIKIYMIDKDYFNWMNEKKYFSFNEKDLLNEKEIINKELIENENIYNYVIEYLNINLPLNNDIQFNKIFEFIKFYNSFVSNSKYINNVFKMSSVIDFMYNDQINIKYRVEIWLSEYINSNLKFQKDLNEYLWNIDNFEIATIKRALWRKNRCINQDLYHKFLYFFSKGQIYKHDDIKNYLEIFKNFNDNYIDTGNFIEKNITETSMKLKLWVHKLIDEFDYNTYSVYFFTLNSQEKRIFNKRVKDIMRDKLIKSMISKREPWSYNYDNDRNKYQRKATWRSIWFEDGYIKICMDTEPSFTRPYYWKFSESKFNFLFEYIKGKKLPDLKINYENDNINEIIGLELLEELIWKVTIKQVYENKNNSNIINRENISKIPINILLRNSCIQLLNKYQLNGLEPTRVLEKSYNLTTGNSSIDVSLLFSIKLNADDVAIIWESLEIDKSKATHIFKCKAIDYEFIFKEIELYISNNFKVRSSLNSKMNTDSYIKEKLKYLTRIEHDNFNFNKWLESLYTWLPELKLISTE